MNKKRFIKEILTTIDNAKFLDEDPTENIDAILSTLEPKDRKQFAQWGHSDFQSTEKDCWD